MLSSSVELLKLVVPRNYGVMTHMFVELSDKSIVDRVKQFANDNCVSVYKHLVYPIRTLTDQKYDYTGWSNDKFVKRPEKADILTYNLEIWYDRQLECSQPEYTNTDGPL